MQTSEFIDNEQNQNITIKKFKKEDIQTIFEKSEEKMFQFISKIFKENRTTQENNEIKSELINKII